VELHYTDGRAVNDETMTSPDYTVDGGPGDEITGVVVNSSTSVQSFTCQVRRRVRRLSVLVLPERATQHRAHGLHRSRRP